MKKRKKAYGKIERAEVEIGCVKCKTSHKLHFKGYRGQSRRSMLSRCWTTIKASYEAMGWRKLEEGWVCNRCTGIRGWLFKEVFAEDTKKVEEIWEALSSFLKKEDWEPMHVSYATMTMLGTMVGMSAESEEELRDRLEFVCENVRDLGKTVFDALKEE